MECTFEILRHTVLVVGGGLGVGSQRGTESTLRNKQMGREAGWRCSGIQPVEEAQGVTTHSAMLKLGKEWSVLSAHGTQDER